MTLTEAVREGKKTKLPFARTSWTHSDHLKVFSGGSDYMGGELRWESGERAQLFYVEDLTASDWKMKDRKFI